MVDITTFKVNGKVLELVAAIKDLSYFDDVTIDKVTIYNQDGFSTDSSKAVALYELTVGAKSVNTTITEAQLTESIEGNLFIVKITTSGTPSADTPCGMDVDTVYSGTFSKCYITSLILGNILELGSECHIPKQFIDTLLGYEAIKLACETGNAAEAVTLYNKIYSKNKITNSTVSGCGCHA